MAKATDFSLADFHYNDNPDVMSPPQDFDEWLSDPEVQKAFSFTGRAS
jgi:hypothetical protein